MKKITIEIDEEAGVSSIKTEGWVSYFELIGVLDYYKNLAEHNKIHENNKI